jgi:secreted trypsin-like serine protease
MSLALVFVTSGNFLSTLLQGDSGGPLMIQQPDTRWVLAGTVSHGIKCAYPDLPGVYMRMTYYKPWIERITGYSL